MTKITLNEPTSIAAPKHSDSVDIVDSLGRTLTVKEPGVLDESRLARLMGDSSTNTGYMLGYVMPASMVAAINGENVPFPRTELQVDAAIQRLGREGLRAVMEHLTKKAEDSAAKADEIKK